jgi:ribonuclease HI
MIEPFWQESVVVMPEYGAEATTHADSALWADTVRQIVAVYADGGVFRPRRCEAGSWAWVGADCEDRRLVYQRGWLTATGMLRDGVTNNLSEFAAVLKALETMARHVPGWSGRVCSDSEMTIGRFSAGWRMMGVPKTWHMRMRAALDSLGRLEFVLLKGHPLASELAAGFGRNRNSERVYPVSHHQVLCDTLCTRTIQEWGLASGTQR